MLCPACSGKSAGPCVTPLQCGGPSKDDRLRNWFESVLRSPLRHGDALFESPRERQVYPIMVEKA
jgi:hypothetical protein